MSLKGTTEMWPTLGACWGSPLWIKTLCIIPGLYYFILRGFNGQQPNFHIKFEHFSKCQHLDDIPSRSPWPILFENDCRFSLVAMVTRLGLWLVKHGNKRNSKTNFRSTFKIGRVVHKNNSHKTLKLDFWRSCHGNQEVANLGILWRNLKFEKKSKKGLHGFVDIGLLHMSTKNYANRIYPIWVTSVPVTQVCDFPHFEISEKTFQKYKNW